MNGLAAGLSTNFFADDVLSAGLLSVTALVLLLLLFAMVLLLILLLSFAIAISLPILLLFIALLLASFESPGTILLMGGLFASTGGWVGCC